MRLPYAEPHTPTAPGPRTIPEPPRPGDPGGDPCRLCAVTDEGIWSDRNWTAHSPTGTSLPGTIWLKSRIHVDSFADLPPELASDFGRISGRIERAILSLGDVGRVHLNRWGDGVAHFHAWYLPRPLGMLEATKYMLPLWEDVLPPADPAEIAAAGRAIAAALNR